MKILFATPLFPPSIGGPATYASLFVQNGPLYGDLDVIYLSFENYLKYPSGIRHFLFAYKLFKMSINRDIIFAQDAFSVALPARIVAWIRRKPFVIRLPGDFAWEQAVQRCGIKDTISDFQHTRYGLYIELLKWIERGIVRSADIVMTPSKTFSTIVQGWTTRNVFTVYNGIDTKKMSHIVKKNESNHFSIVTSGRLVPWKGFLELIEVVAQHPNWRCHIIGSGPDEEKIKDYIKKNNLSSTVLLSPKMSQDDLWQHIKNADVFVLNSRFESFSYQVVEVMALGVPVVVPTLSNLEEIVEDGVSGIFINPYEKETLHSALLRLSSEDVFRKTLGDNAQKRANNFSIEATIVHWKRIVKESLQRDTLVFLGTDKNAFSTSSETHKRLCRYGSFATHVVFLIPTKKDEPYTFFSVGNVQFVPTQSRHVMLSVFDICKEVYKFRKKIRAISPQNPFILGLIGLILARYTKSKLFTQIHTDLFSPWYFNSSFKSKIETYIARYVIKKSDFIRVVSQGLYKNISHITHAPCAVLPLPVVMHTHKDFSSPKASKRIHFITISRLESEKNIKGVLRAFSQILVDFPDDTLTIVGDGSLKSELMRYAQELSIDHCVFWKGWVSDISVYLRDADVFIQNSYYEGYGVALMESLIYGLPSISTEVGVAKEVIKDTYNGFIIPVGSHQDLVNSMRKVHSRYHYMQDFIHKNPTQNPYDSYDMYINTMNTFFNLS